MTDWDRTLPAPLAEANALTYDYNEGNGVDFEPYPEFLGPEDTGTWIRAWSGNTELDGSEFRVFGQDGTGGYAAFQHYKIYLPGLIGEWRDPRQPTQEVVWNQGPAVRVLLEAAGFSEVATERDLEGRDRVSLGRWSQEVPGRAPA